MKHAVLSADHEPDDLPRRSGVMAGAESALPDSARSLDDLIADHAVRAWGQLRDRDKLDSAGAVQVLGVAMARLLQAANGRKIPAEGLDILGRKISPGRPKAGT